MLAWQLKSRTLAPTLHTDTSHPLAGEGGYDNICIVQHMQQVGAAALSTLAPGAVGPQQPGDILSGVVVAAVVFEEAQPDKGRKPPKELFIISHGAGAIEASEQVTSIAGQLKEHKVALTLL